MTRKDYVLIAEALKLSPPKDRGADFAYGADWMHEVCVSRLANALANDNPRFDRDRFLKACGIAS